MTMKEDKLESDFHKQTGKGVDMILKSAMARKTADNITCSIVTFNNYLKYFERLVENVSNRNSNYERKELKSEKRMKHFATEGNINTYANTHTNLNMNTNMNKREDNKVSEYHVKQTELSITPTK